MTPKQAQLILDDDCLDSLIDASTPEYNPEDDTMPELHEALIELVRHLEQLAQT
jgi:hypothetical protein